MNHDHGGNPEPDETLPHDPDGTLPFDVSADEGTLSFAAGDAPIGQPTIQHPEAIGPYRIESVLGEGGMGTVYLAQQTEPVKRKVALKLIRRGMALEGIVARFQAERQVLALLDHPGIAKILDAGVAPDGTPFFIMEYVDGQPLADFCDEEKLSIRERLELFLQICEAVQHAHYRGIIHRDLKPSNVLVSEIDGRREAKVIDFGVAKAVDPDATESDLYTEVGIMIGTPEYMSPEQAANTGDGVDTRTDVYSLGVLLYELLVGVLPFDGAALRSAGYVEMQRRIQEDAVARPSTRVSGLGAELPDTASHRTTTVAALQKQLRGDLDWITMKAMEKERDRRYATPDQLAADIQRFLSSEPVIARPPSWGYVTAKFVRKYRVAVAAGLAIFIGITTGLVASWLNWQHAEQRKDQILRLSNLRRYQDYVAEADGLWPCTPAIAPRMREWIDNKARPLVANLPKHKERLAELAQLALPYDEATRTADREAHPDYDSLTRSKLELSKLPPDHQLTEAEELNAMIAELEQRVSERSSWEFTEVELSWEHDLLQRLVRLLEEMEDPDPAIGLIANVEHRLAFAEVVEEETLVRHADTWERAIREISDATRNPQYDGLLIEPILGLIPLGPDPESKLWEFAHLQTGTPPIRNSAGKLEISEDTGAVFVLVPGGTFMMGCAKPSEERPIGTDSVDEFARDIEGPPHEVRLDPFLVSKYELTQAQWRRLAHRNPSLFQRGHGEDIELTEQHPVENLTWTEFDDLLTNYGLLLPTEAQWEYAARGGSAAVWSTGHDKEQLEGYANIADSAAARANRKWDAIKDWAELDDGFPLHAPVGSFAANGFGLHDVHGNVWEWCRDPAAEKYDVPAADGTGERVRTPTQMRLLRGGSFYNSAKLTRCARRYALDHDTRQNDSGVRPVLPVTPVTSS